MWSQIFSSYSIAYFEDCSNYFSNKLPTIIFELESKNGNFNLNLKPEDYLITYLDGENSICVMGIYPDDIETDLVTIGQEVMKGFTTFFDFGNRRIGFWTHGEKEEKKRFNRS
jgi:hypothetical protein